MNTQLPNKASGTSEKGDGLHQSGRKGQRTKLSLIFGVNFSSCFSISGSAFCLIHKQNHYHCVFSPQDIDGQALLLLTLPTVQECMELKLGPAIKLCHQIERVKVAFYAQYAN